MALSIFKAAFATFTTRRSFKDLVGTAGVMINLLLAAACLYGCSAKPQPKPVVLPEAFSQAPAISTKPSKNFACPETPAPYIEQLVFTSKYEGSDKSRSTLNMAAYEEYMDQTESIVNFQKTLSGLSDKYFYTGDKAIRDCALGMLNAWATAPALLSKDTNHTGRSARKWTLAAASSSYAKLTHGSIKNDPPNAKQIEAIEHWLATIADIVVVDYTQSNIDKVNNHDYWAAWAVSITGAVLHRKDLLDWSYSKFSQAMNQVDDNGFLPNEIRRKHLALSYHNFAIQPLVSMALTLKVNDYDVLSINNRALERLVNKTVAGLSNPEIFLKQTGEEQTLNNVVSNTGLAWIEPWLIMEPNAKIPAEWKNLRPLSSSRMGGDLTLLYTKQRVKKEKE